MNEMRAAEEKTQKAKIGLWEDEGLAKYFTKINNSLLLFKFFNLFYKTKN